MAAMGHAWRDIHKLTFSEVDSFDVFFSNFFTAQNKLSELNSIAITDNAFLHSLLFHKPNVDKTKSNTAQFILQDLSKHFSLVTKLDLHAAGV